MTASAMTGTILILGMVVMMHSVSCAPLTTRDTYDTEDVHTTEHNSTQNFSLVDQDGLFEGDIKINEDFIHKYYNFSSIPGGEKYDGSMIYKKDKSEDDKELKGDEQKVEKRAALKFDSLLWTDAKVPYQFSSTISTNFRLQIRSAMDHWEDRTCLRFTARNGESDYVEYINRDYACWSNIGRGSGQNINIIHGACPFGTVVHEIGHTVGFFHEQSRPDRDNYVRINFNNVQNGASSEFMKLTEYINSRGSEYDYGSIMHYPATAFVRDNCDGCQTIEVTNMTAYVAQGSPTLGHSTGLSERDIQQANILYSCPARRGITGSLRVHIRNGQSLPDTDPAGDTSDPYVKITAVDSSGIKHTRSTTMKSDTTSPNWNENLNFSNREWQFFRIQVWDDDGSVDDEMSISETVVVTPGAYTNLRHNSRLDSSTNGYVSFDYTLQ